MSEHLYSMRYEEHESKGEIEIRIMRNRFPTESLGLVEATHETTFSGVQTYYDLRRSEITPTLASILGE